MNHLAREEFWSSGRNAVLLPEHSSVSETEISAALGKAGFVVFQTSGTAGQARFVCHTRAGLLASAEAVNAHLEASNKDVWLCALPHYHVGGFGVFARAYCSNSMAYGLDGAWSGGRFVERCVALEVSLVSLVPTQVFDLVEAGHRCPFSLRAVLVGGGHLDARLEERARELAWPIMKTYGLSEAGSQVATQHGDDLLLLPHLEAASGADGRLKLRGESMANGYLSAAGSGGWRFAPCLESDGWFQTDDLVELDGRILRFLGRASARVKVLGELVDVEALERAFLTSKSGQQGVALVDVPDARCENILVLAYTAEQAGAELAPLVHAFNASVAGFERIARLVEIEALPRGALGKVRRGELRERVIKAEK